MAGLWKLTLGLGGGLALAGAAIAAPGLVAALKQGRGDAPPAISSPSSEAPRDLPQPVRVTLVIAQPLQQVRTYTGLVRSQSESPLGFRVAGKLIERLVDRGETVTPGQLLARLDPTDFQLDLDATAAERTAAAIDLDRASAAFGRTSALTAEGFAATAARDAATSGLAEARARLDRAEKAQALAANRLAYATLVADRAGVVTDTLAEPGQVVAAGQPVVTVAGTDRLDLRIDLPEQQRDTLGSMRATAVIWHGDGSVLPLSLRDVTPDVDPVSRTYRARFALDRPDPALLGRSAIVTLTPPAAEEVFALPLGAVLSDAAGSAVWRVDPGGAKVDRVAVTLVAVSDDVALLRGPLADGDRVVSLGAHKIDPSRPVRVVETGPAPTGR